MAEASTAAGGHFAEVAPTWAQRYANRPSFRSRLSCVSPIVLSAVRSFESPLVLDLGAGAGVFSAVASTKAALVVAVDPSPQMIAAALQSQSEVEEMVEKVAATPRFDRIKYVRGTVDALRGGTGKFDVVLLVSLLEYLPDAARVMADVVSFLSQQGVVIVTLPKSTSPVRIFEGPMNRILMRLGSLFPIDRLRDRSYEALLVRRSSRQWLALLRASGLQVKDQTGIPLGLGWPLRLFTPNLAIELQRSPSGTSNSSQ